MTRPLVSVVVPSYNRADILGKTIDAIIAQTYSPIEIIIIDDASTDSTEALIHSYQQRVDHIVYIKHEMNLHIEKLQPK